jgi:hypothetical protein
MVLVQKWISFHHITGHYFILICLCFVTHMFAVLVEPYVAEGEQILHNPDFKDDMDAWQITGPKALVRASDGVVEINHQSRKQSSSISQCFQRTELGDQMLVGIEAKVSNLTIGNKPWLDARIGMVLYTFQGEELYHLSHELLQRKADAPWGSYKQEISLPRAVEKVCFRISLYGSKGVFQVTNPTLYKARATMGFQLGRGMLMVAWLGFGLYWLKLLVQHYRLRPQGRYLVAAILVMVLGILLPSDWKFSLQWWLFSLLPALKPEFDIYQPDITQWFFYSWLPLHWDLSKFSHLVGYFVLSSILFSERAKSAWILLSALLLAAISSEVLQYFVPGRTPRISDVVVDSLGIIIGWWVGRFYLWCCSNAQRTCSSTKGDD